MNQCCNKELEKKVIKGKVYLKCSVCNKQGAGNSEYEANQKFNGLNQALAIPNSPQSFAQNIRQRKNEMMQIIAPFVKAEESAVEKLINDNIRYVTQNKDLEKCFGTAAGQESLVKALEDAFSLGATLPQMGCIVGFGGTAQFMPGMEAYVFALTNGKDAPFSDISAYFIYEKDEYEMSRDDDGKFFFKTSKIGIDRGEIAGVVVRGFHKELGFRIGDSYTMKQLQEKGKKHSKQPLNYDGPNKGDFCRKLAIKNFFKGFLRVRCSIKAFQEEEKREYNDEPVREIEVNEVDGMFDKATAAIDTVIPDEIVDAEIVTPSVEDMYPEGKE